MGIEKKFVAPEVRATKVNLKLEPLVVYIIEGMVEDGKYKSFEEALSKLVSDGLRSHYSDSNLFKVVKNKSRAYSTRTRSSNSRKYR